MSEREARIISKIAERQNVEAERKRKAKAAELNRKAEERRRAAHEADERQRAEAQETLKLEVKGCYKTINAWATDEDFERAWKSDKERLIREYRETLGRFQSM